ncbi:hypothetical protein BBI00_04515 [Chryseobacterium arthrosphaerae]|uniref:Uncharacterized protein n=2 Tax=Chryseobacterium arthrosphaerae TaxID=651561 RepID=A0A1B8ZVQ0_9FLAO|nr:hypothetical protein BBI00_04515 [Chryseobacterium arthrosphaerae]
MTNQVAKEKQITYTIAATAAIPVVIYFNDIKVSEENTPLNTSIDLNGYALKNGKYKIKIQIFPVFRRGDTMVNPEDIKSCQFSFGSFIRNRDTGDILDPKTYNRLSIKVPDAPVPYFEQEWEVEVKELPYDLEGWSKGQDLSKMDKKELEKKVVDFHEKVREVLNQGNGDKWAALTKTRAKETASFYYSSNEQYEKSVNENKLSVEKYCTNNMVPLEDYELKLYAQGKLVTLERKNHTMEFNNKSPLDIKGWGALIRKGQKSGAADYRILLYLPQGSNDFVIIRK